MLRNKFLSAVGLDGRCMEVRLSFMGTWLPMLGFAVFHADHRNGEFIKIFEIVDTNESKIRNLKEGSCHIANEVLASVTAASCEEVTAGAVCPLRVCFLFGSPLVAFPQKRLHCKLM